MIGEILQTPERALSHNTPDVPPQAPQRQNASPTESDQDDVRVYTSTCTGVFKATIEASQIENKSDVLKGFGHVAGNVIRWLGSYVSNHNGSHPFGRDTMGYIVGAKSCDDTYTWEMKQTFYDDESMFTFYHRDCTGEADGIKELCKECRKNQYKLYQMCRQEVELRNQQNPTLLGRHDYMKHKSPALVFPYIQELSKRIRVLSSNVRYLKATVSALKKKAIQTSNINHDLLFDKEALRSGYNELMCKAEVHEQEIFTILFKECMLVQKRIDKKGNAKGHVYSELLMKFAISLRGKMSQSNYDFVRQVFGLPANSTLCVYRNADTTADDGLMHQTIQQNAEFLNEFIEKDGGTTRGYNNNDEIVNDFRRFGSLCFDSHTINDSKLGKLLVASL